MKDKIIDADFSEIEVEKYTDEYSEEGLWKKIKENVTSIGIGLIYKALQLYYVAQSPTCPMKVKAGIYGALGYLISPFDFIPDITPIVGYTDDAAAIGIALLLAQMYINDDIKAQAKGKIKDIFGAKALEKLDED
ncbi:Protein of unknown function [Anaerovibrio lipolyticus DSM 3074]|uniref:DUF1232 domain-containing protein n=2 Tax=Anaerovibrio lipolyticus TaxID=82374 RepID=A0A0B2K2B8_9FIRM|nr:DUF1232 domain-containing protein [Anaerovibrio lipolyticus]KHM52921.1 hypothetical protein NZ47_01870 [Anaerovibrio lipolyticus]SHI29101.1 Protein of unknown function [Anaerovibrio lipolyticus DSM 3074]